MPKKVSNSQASQEIRDAYAFGYRSTKGGRIVLNGERVPLIIKETTGTRQVTPTQYYVFIGKYPGSPENYIRVHRFVAYCKYGEEAFLHLVRHKNDISLDNSWDNLLLGDHRSNALDISPELRRERAQRAAEKKRKLTPEQRAEIPILKEYGWSYSQLAARYGVCVATIQIYVRKNEPYPLPSKPD